MAAHEEDDLFEENEEQEKILRMLEKNPRVELHEDGKRTVTLSEPVDYAGGKIDKLTFRKPKGRDWRDTDKVKGGNISRMFAMAAALTDKPIKLFDEMPGDDALLCTMVAGIMGKSLETGGNSLPQ